MGRIALLLKAAAGVAAFLGYVWFAAVRLAPRVKRRKAARRAEILGRSDAS